MLLSQAGPQSLLWAELQAAPVNLSALALQLDSTCHPGRMKDHGSIIGCLSWTIFAFQHGFHYSINPKEEPGNFQRCGNPSRRCGLRGPFFRCSSDHTTSLLPISVQFSSTDTIFTSLTVQQALPRRSHLPPSTASFY